MKMMRLPLLACAALVVAAMPLRAETPVSTLMTVVTSPDPQTQLMAMVLTMQAVKQGVRGHVLLCGPAGDLALKDAPESATSPQKPNSMSPQGLMQTIMRETATEVQVCALYLPNKGLEASALIDGVSVASPPAMAERLIADDARIMSF